MKNYIKGVSIWKWIVLLTVLLFYFLSMYYADIKVTYQFSFSFLDALFDGNILQFYQYALDTGVAPEGAVYDILIYVVFAIWGLPIWLVHKFIAFDYLSIGCMMWFKLLLVVFTVGTSVLLSRIAGILDYSEETREDMTFFYYASMYIVLPIFAIAQYDVIPLFFILAGTYYYLRKDNPRFILFFAIAMAMKPFAALLFVPFVFLREKKIRRILLNGLGGMSLFLLCKVLYLPSEAYRNSGASFLSGMVYKLFEISIPIGSGNLSFFCMGMIIICIIAYYIRDEKKDNPRIIVLLACSVWMVFTLLVNVVPYWVVYLAPFLCLVVFMSPARRNLCLILDLVMNVALLFSMIINYDWVVGGSHTFADLIFRNVYERHEDQIMSIGKLLEMYKFTKLLPAVNAVMISAAIVLFYIAAKSLKSNTEPEQTDRWHCWSRLCMIYIWAAVCLGMLFLDCR